MYLYNSDISTAGALAEAGQELPPADPQTAMLLEGSKVKGAVKTTTECDKAWRMNIQGKDQQLTSVGI